MHKGQEARGSGVLAVTLGVVAALVVVVEGLATVTIQIDVECAATRGDLSLTSYSLAAARCHVLEQRFAR